MFTFKDIGFFLSAIRVRDLFPFRVDFGEIEHLGHYIFGVIVDLVSEIDGLRF